MISIHQLLKISKIQPRSSPKINPIKSHLKHHEIIFTTYDSQTKSYQH